jgi:hypothetical protein
MVKPTEEELAAHEAEKYGDPDPDFEGVRPGDADVPEGDLQFDGDEGNPDENGDENEGAGMVRNQPTNVDFPEDDEDGDDEPEAPREWYPGAACLACNARDYKWTVAWGQGCSKCLTPDEDDA